MFIINNSGDNFDYSITETTSTPITGQLMNSDATTFALSGGPYTLSVGFPSSSQGPYSASVSASGSVEVASGTGIQETTEELGNCCLYKRDHGKWVQTASACTAGFECMPVSDVDMRYPTGHESQTIEIPCEPR